MRRRATSAAVAAALAAVPVRSETISLVGGLDLVTPPMQLKSGMCRRAQNFEASLYGGYRRIAGYERFDGRESPSEAVYGILNVEITGSISVGQTVVGATSGATAVVIAVVNNDDESYLAITKISASFQNGETLNVGGIAQGTAQSNVVLEGTSSVELHARYKNLAADEYRNDIEAVPGSGPILGVHIYHDVVYAFRNNESGTAAEMYRSTSSGWQKVDFEYEVEYTDGTGDDLVDGATLTQGGVSATIRRVLVRTGSLSGGTAAGTLVISEPVGGNFAAGSATVDGSSLTLVGAQSAITLLPNGRFEFVNENFGGGITTKRMYGCDGVNPAFEFDGTNFVPIHTGMTVDAPNHIAAHKNHLFLAFGGSVQHSSIGYPYGWSPITGAAEIGMGDDVTGFAVQPGSQAGGALAIFTRNRLSVLYGSSASDWQLVPYRDELGAYPYTIQDVGYTMFLDDRGITDLQTSQAFGNFAHNAISDRVRTLVNEYRTMAVASCISRDRSQYRIFFSNKAAFYVTVAGRKVVGIMPMAFADVVRCTASGEMSNGSEVMFFGSDDGFVYQMDKGTSFDGDPIEAYIDLAYNFLGSPNVLKTYHEAMVEISGGGYAAFTFGYELGYGSADYEQPTATAINFEAVFWDNFTWDNFTWDGVTLVPNALDLSGTANNISLAFRTSSDYYEPFTITGVVLTFSPRRRIH